MDSRTRTDSVSQVSLFVVLLASTFLMGSSFVAAKILINHDFPPMMLAGWRFFVAAIATLPMAVVETGSLIAILAPVREGLRSVAVVIVIGVVQTGAVMGLLFWALQFISASNAAILLFTNPIWVAVLGRIFLKENLQRGRMIGLSLGVIGVAFAIGLGPDSKLTGSTDGAALAGEIIGLGSAVCWAIATIINKRANLPLGPWVLSFWQMLFGSMAILSIAYGGGERWPAFVTWENWGWFFWLAVPASTGSFGLWFVALSKGGATKTSGFLFLAPLFTAILSYFILSSSLSWTQAAGGALIGFALWLVGRDRSGEIASS